MIWLALVALVALLYRLIRGHWPRDVFSWLGVAIAATLVFVLLLPAERNISLVTLQRTTTAECQLPREVVHVTLSRTRWPNVYEHERIAIRKGWPAVMVLDRDGESARRARLLRGHPTAFGLDRDEYPLALGREGWLADVASVPSSENRSHGAYVGARLRGYCNGARFTFDWSTP